MNIVNYKQQLGSNVVAFENAIAQAVEDVKQAIVQYNINSDSVDQQLLQKRALECVGEEYLMQRISGDVAVAEHRNLYNFKQMHVNDALMPFMHQLYPNSTIKPSGFFVYPANNGFMSWHTNSNAPGTRVYIAYVEQAGASCFKYYADNKICTSWDSPGITMREFQVDAKNLLWHCVYAKCNRYSFGFRVNKID